MCHAIGFSFLPTAVSLHLTCCPPVILLLASCYPLADLLLSFFCSPAILLVVFLLSLVICCPPAILLLPLLPSSCCLSCHPLATLLPSSFHTLASLSYHTLADLQISSYLFYHWPLVQALCWTRLLGFCGASLRFHLLESPPPIILMISFILLQNFISSCC